MIPGGFDCTDVTTSESGDSALIGIGCGCRTASVNERRVRQGHEGEGRSAVIGEVARGAGDAARGDKAGIKGQAIRAYIVAVDIRSIDIGAGRNDGGIATGMGSDEILTTTDNSASSTSEIATENG